MMLEMSFVGVDLRETVERYGSRDIRVYSDDLQVSISMFRNFKFVIS
jgi:hypothetical protein